MTALHAVSRTLYSRKRWKKISNLLFAQRDNVVPVGVSELPKAILSTAVGFLTVDDYLTPVALQGLIAGQNWFLTQDGKWQGDYLPAIYGCYPFRLAKAENGELVLCVDEDSGLVVDNATAEGELFFDSEGNPAPLVTQILNDLKKIERDAGKARQVCTLLKQYELFEPWPIEMKGDHGVQKIEGLYRINEERLNSIPVESLIKLRDHNALLVAYAQLFSMHNLHKLGRLGSTYNSSRNKGQALNLDIGMLSDSGTISFENL